MKILHLLFVTAGVVIYSSSSHAVMQVIDNGNTKTLVFPSNTMGGSSTYFEVAKPSGPSRPNAVVLSPSGKTVAVTTVTDLKFSANPKHFPVTSVGTVGRAAFMRGVGSLVGGPGGLALLALPAVVAYINSTGGFRVNPGTGEVQKTSPSLQCPPPSSGYGPWITGWQDAQPGYWTPSIKTINGTCYFGLASASGDKVYETKPKSSAAVWLPASMDDIAQYMDTPEAPTLTPGMVYESFEKHKLNGINPFGVPSYPPASGSSGSSRDPVVSKPAVSGPSTVPGQKTTTTSQTSVNSGTTTESTPGSSNPSQPATKTVTNTTTHNNTYNNNNINQTSTTTTVTNITNNVTNQTTTINDKTETKEDNLEPKDDIKQTPNEKDENPEEPPPTDTPLPAIPELYERKYPDGLVGIWETKSQEMKDSPLFTLADQLMPTGISGGSCPSWSLDLSFGGAFGDYGSQDVSPPCWIWDVAKLIIIASALILARALVFGG